MDIKKTSFGYINNKEIFKYTLSNEMLEISILNYGGIIQKINMKNKEGKFENIVLGFDDIDDYVEKSPYFGAIIGRVAGRISNSKFKIEDKEYSLNANYDNGVSCHGGNEGFNQKIWKVSEIKQANEIGLDLTYRSLHLEEGYPGELEVLVKYRLTLDNKLTIEYFSKTTEKTIINLTNHSYFNLSGNLKENVLNHYLYIDSNEIFELDSLLIPTGEKINVENTAFDFRTEKKIGTHIKNNEKQIILANGYDHAFILNNKNNKVCDLYDEKSGRGMMIYTDQESVVIYSGNGLGEIKKGRYNEIFRNNDGICFETQAYPNRINMDYEPKIYDENNPYYQKTIFKFYLK